MQSAWNLYQNVDKPMVYIRVYVVLYAKAMTGADHSQLYSARLTS